ncbi:Y-family DNA polymerase [Bacillus swezeyi]|uniref:UV damage repair protein UvrX n=1 Tax=Bacillus swezeyi TaxID=1925020 RepID=A0A5M8REG0_9BACI|nr:UV damage repair protein UvrX [Bacillus swezeyi]KAA6446965.1 UV damage repair protein UvrX [Bacillus swezeyi]KAA6471533.1 UV damage repair protein UvrX [Bacillus swezeyi]
MDYSQYPARSILCVDMRSFYASCAAVSLGLDPMTCFLAVVGNTERQGSVVLAASPALKKEYGVKTGTRLFQIPDDPRIKIVNPQMALFVRVSTELTKLFSRYVPHDAIHTYSVDESFLQVDGVENMWGDAQTIATKIQDDMKREFGLPCTVGIGPNMLLAKLCLDLDAKKSERGIAVWGYPDVKTKLWPISPLQQMWGIGSRLEKTLNRMGIFSVGQLAQFDLKRLEKKFGIMGNQLYYHAWGIDLSAIGTPIMNGQISYGKSQILLRDYPNPDEVKHVILEMCEEVAKRARNHQQVGRTISLGIEYSRDELGGGFYRSKTMEAPSNITLDLYQTCLALFDHFYEGKTVRKISVSLSNIQDDNQIQLDLFRPDQEKKRILGYVMDGIRERYGSSALLRAVSYTNAGTARLRSKLVGGHQA